MTLDTKDPEYAKRLDRLLSPLWKRCLHVQAPYRWNLRRLAPGFTLDIGCGIGRNLGHLDGQGVGVDHNAEAVRIARERGYRAFLPADFLAGEYAVDGRFDSLLLAHVAEHLVRRQVVELIAEHLRFVKRGGQLILITPQERGFQSDPTHVEFTDFAALSQIAASLGLREVRTFSFPFPRAMGKFFVYNEFVSVSVRP